MTNVNNIYLINAGNDDSIVGVANDGTFPALGILSLATTLREYLPEVNVQVDDGQVTSKKNIEKRIRSEKPDVVGVSVLSTSYRSSLDYARVAKEVGATVIFGNDQPALFGENMLREREEIDYICTADIGELSFVEFIEYLRGEKGIGEVRKLLYRGTTGAFQYNDLPELPTLVELGRNKRNLLDAIPVADRTLFTAETWRAYLKNYLSKYGSFHKQGEVTGVTTINRARGCARVKDPCTYCGIANLTLRFSSPAMFWKEVESAKDQVNANIFYEAFDSFSSAPRWIQDLIDSKPKKVEDAKFFVYTQAYETNDRLIEKYKRLGVIRVNMGIDSGDDTMLKRLKGPKDSLEHMKTVLLQYRDNGINVYGSLVLGAPGENYQSLENSVRFGEWLVDEGIVSALEAQPLFPELNAKAGHWMFNLSEARKAAAEMGFAIQDEELLGQMPDKWLHQENPDPDAISRDWATIFCEVDYDDLLETSREIRKYAASKNVAEGSAFF